MRIPRGFSGPGLGGGAGHPILVTDTNADGLNDIILGSAHGYGLLCYRQRMEHGKRSFIEHWIETEYPTFHTMVLADLDGDSRPELITGKQMLAHNGGDVGAFEPTFLFYYTMNQGHFQRHILSYSHLLPYFTQSRDDPPPNYVIGTGMKLNAEDMDGDGQRDIIVACRTGPAWSPAARERPAPATWLCKAGDRRASRRRAQAGQWLTSGAVDWSARR